MAESILITVASAPMRRLLKSILEAQGLTVYESVDGMDAVHCLSNEELPSSILISSELGQNESGIGLMRGISKLKKTQYIPGIVMFNSSNSAQDLIKNPLPKHIIPMKGNSSLKQLSDDIFKAYTEGKNKAEEIVGTKDVDESECGYLTEYNNKSDLLDIAFDLMRHIVDLVKKDQLPGPMMPKLLQQVRELFSDRNIEFNKIADFIQKHQALSVRVMALANSAYYSRGAPLKTILQAVSRLGFKNIGSILQAIAAKEFIVGRDKKLQELIKENLEKSYFVGVIAEEMASIIQFRSPQEVFTIGLFHNVGAIFLMYTFALLEKAGKCKSIDTQAIKTMTRNKASALNRLVFKAMNLPKEVNMIFSTDKTESPESDSNQMVRLVNQGIWIADIIIDKKKTRIEPNDESELLGIETSTIEILNEKLPDLLNLLAAYRS